MYCTAGVRCERASSYLRNNLGLEDVYQLEGGIHRYLEVSRPCTIAIAPTQF